MIADELSTFGQELINLRRDFHADPELGQREYHTSQKIISYLAGIGLKVNTICNTGVTATITGKKPGAVVMLRADMDALPIKEETNLPYASRNEGVMHACGHDGHVAMLLVVAKILAAHRNELQGTIKLVFQPNEEVAGALDLIHEGILEFPIPDYVLGVHLWTPLSTGTLGLSEGPVMAANDAFFIKIKGKGGHSGSPESAVDPILAASAVIQALQSIQTREISLLKPTSIVVGQINSGSAPNVIPEVVELAGSVRYLYQGGADSRERPLQRLERIVKSACQVYGATCEVHFVPSNPCVINHPYVVEAGKWAAERISEVSHVEAYITLAGEDFGEYTARIPGAFCFVGAGNREKGCDYPHHHPKFNIDEDALIIGARWLYQTTIRLLETHEKNKGGCICEYNE